MGIYVNPKNESFRTSLNSFIYVDKSLIVRELNKVVDTNQKYICVSRPRRFGKSMAKRLLVSYYSKGCDSHELFKDLKISKEPTYEKYLNKFNVVSIDFNDFVTNLYNIGEDSLIKAMNRKVSEEFPEEFPEIDFSKCQNIADCIKEVYKRTGIKFVILMDEYDLIVRSEPPKAILREYLDFLITLFKSEATNDATALAYITGILPIVREKVESKLNNFDEITFLKPYNFVDFTGFTEDEVKELCETHDINFQECLHWYDGYGINGKRICNPEAIVKAVTRRDFDCYWSATGSYETVSPYIKSNYQGIKDDLITMLAGGSVPVFIQSFTNSPDHINSKDTLFTYLMHIGFLAYDDRRKRCRIPNLETLSIWRTIITQADGFAKLGEFICNSERLYNATIDGDSDTVASTLEDLHDYATSNLSYNHEQSLQTIINFAYIYARTNYTLFNELPTGKGYADVVFVPFYPNYPAMIVELKRNSSTDSAINQIKARNYSQHLAHYKGKLLFVGINYDDNKGHQCKMEWFEME